MSRQISFYMAGNDEEKFSSYLISTGDIVMISNVMQKPGEFFGDFSELDKRSMKYGNSCYLWNRSISVEPPIKYYKEKNYYCVDSMQSEVVQMRRAKADKNELRMGRLYIETTFINADEKIYKKGESFLGWYDQLAKWIKKNYKKLERSIYISEHAMQLKDGGVKLGHYSF